MNTSEIKTEITIDFSKLSAEQAFRLGQLLAEVPTTVESSFTSEATLFAVPEVAEKKIKVIRRNKNKSRKFAMNTPYPDGFIRELIDIRKTGKTFAEIAQQLNEAGIKTQNGKLWPEKSVWDVIYSKQALKYWTAA